MWGDLIREAEEVRKAFSFDADSALDAVAAGRLDVSCKMLVFLEVEGRGVFGAASFETQRTCCGCSTTS